MTARPLDYGDQNPSDIGDTPPVSRAQGFSEADYQVSSSLRQRSTRARPRYPLRANPNAKEAKKEDITPQDAFTVLLIKDLGNRQWRCLRHDGKIQVAQVVGVDGVYDELKVGEYATMTRGPDASKWLLSGDNRHNELSVMQVTNNGDISFSKGDTKKVEMNEVITTTGSDTESSDGGIKVKKTDKALYRIAIKITAKCQNPDPINDDDDPAAVSHLRVRAACFGGNITTEHKLTEKPKVMNFKRNVGFVMEYEPISKESRISINVPETEFIPQTPAGGADIVWTDTPKIANSIEVGTKQGQGWVKIVCQADAHLWLGHGDIPLKLRFPNKAPSFGSHLMISGMGGAGCTQLKWSKGGGRGEIKIYCSYCDLDKTWKVEDGLVISGPDISAPSPSDGEPAICNSVDRRVWTCS